MCNSVYNQLIFGSDYMAINKKNFMAPFYGWSWTASMLEPLRGGSLLFTSKFPETPGAILWKSEGWKADSTLEPPSGFERGTRGFVIQRLCATEHYSDGAQEKKKNAYCVIFES